MTDGGKLPAEYREAVLGATSADRPGVTAQTHQPSTGNPGLGFPVRKSNDYKERLSLSSGATVRLRAAGVADEETREIQEWIKINYKVRGGLDHYLAPFTDDQIAEIVTAWRAQRPKPKPDRPPWCGQCDNDKTRMVDLDDGRVDRCPACNPRHGQDRSRPMREL